MAWKRIETVVKYSTGVAVAGTVVYGVASRGFEKSTEDTTKTAVYGITVAGDVARQGVSTILGGTKAIVVESMKGIHDGLAGNKSKNESKKYQTLNLWSSYKIQPKENIAPAVFNLIDSPTGSDRKSGWYLAKGGHSENVVLWILLNKDGEMKGLSNNKPETK